MTFTSDIEEELVKRKKFHCDDHDGKQDDNFKAQNDNNDVIESETIVTNIQSMMTMPNNSELLNTQDLPKWLIDNPYILGWCRRPNLSAEECIRSIFRLHNQTANIWTHGFGLLLSQYCLFWCFPEHVTAFTDRLFMILAHLGVMASFLCSVIYHTFNACDYQRSRLLSQVDYFGIILHLLLVLMALVYYATYAYPILQAIYVTIYVIILALCLWMNYHCMFSSVTNSMSSSQRSWFFIVVALVSIPPTIMVGPLYGWSLVFRILLNDGIYVLGALVYSTKVPEKWFPGMFDLFNSHTIFHLFIILAGYQTTVSLGILSKLAIETNVTVAVK